MFLENLPKILIIGEEIREDEPYRIKYAEEALRLKGIRFNYHGFLYLYVFEERTNTDDLNSLVLLDKRNSDENGVENELPLDWVQLLEVVKTDIGYIEFVICNVQITDFHDYLSEDLPIAMEKIYEVFESHPFLFRKM